MVLSVRSVSPCLQVHKRRILFHILPNLHSIPPISPYLLFLPFPDDYFLSSSLFFFLLVFSQLCSSCFTIWFCSPYQLLSLCCKPSFSPAYTFPFFVSPCLSTRSLPVLFPSWVLKRNTGRASTPFLPATKPAFREFSLLLVARQLSSLLFDQTGVAQRQTHNGKTISSSQKIILEDKSRRSHFFFFSCCCVVFFFLILFQDLLFSPL